MVADIQSARVAPRREQDTGHRSHGRRVWAVDEEDRDRCGGVWRGRHGPHCT